jgi:diketogulonate reductase-like aldo/keto reductase
MEYITLNNDIKMPILGLGTWDLRGKACKQGVLDALSLGYRLIDTAQMYENEKEVGMALKESAIPRKDVFITTKIYTPNTTYEKTKKAIKKSLQTLQVDYIDLLLIHAPFETAPDMYRAMEEAYADVTVKALGISNFNEKQYAKFIKTCQIMPAVNQVENHVFYQRHDLHYLLSQKGTVLQAWSPFASGKNNLFKNATLTAIGKHYGKTAAQIALKFLVQQGIPCIPKTAHMNYLKENIDIFDFQITEEDMKKLHALDEHKSQFDW